MNDAFMSERFESFRDFTCFIITLKYQALCQANIHSGSYKLRS